MLPKERRDRGQNDFFRALLDQILDLNHGLAKLAWQASIHMLGIECVFTDVLSEFGKGGSASPQPPKVEAPREKSPGLQPFWPPRMPQEYSPDRHTAQRRDPCLQRVDVGRRARSSSE